jgi:hypothetical protein
VPIQLSGRADGQPLSARRQGRPVGGLDQEVQVVVLHGEVEDAKPSPRGRGHALPDDPERGPAPQPSDAGSGPQCEVNGMPALVHRTGAVSDTGPSIQTRPSSARAAAAPGGLESEGKLGRHAILNSGSI